MVKDSLEQIFGAIIALIVLFAVVITFSTELKVSSFINPGLFGLMLLVLFIAFIVEIIRRIMNLFNF